MKKYLALDLGGTFLKAAIIDEEVNIVEKWKVPSAHAKSVDEMLLVFDEAVKGHLDGVDAICMSLPGKMNVKTGVMETAGAFDSFMHECHIVELIEARYGLPAGIDNDAKCATNAEIWKGALQDCENGVVYVIGTGIGGGIEINHQVYRGSHYSSGELSGIYADYEGEWPCQSRAMASYIATPGLLRLYRQKAGIEEEIDGEYFFDKANAGDETAMEVLRYFCNQTAKYFHNIQICLDVDRFAIGGGISAQQILIDTLNEEMDKVFSIPTVATRPELVRCKFGNDANLIGAVKSYLDFH